MNKKLPSYTLTEVLVVLVISAIVIGLALSVLDIVRSHVNKIRQNNENIARVQLADFAIRHYFNNSEVIEYFYTQREIHFSGVRKEEVLRFIKDTLIFPNDSISIPFKDVSFFLKGVPVTKGEIDALKVELDSESGSYLFFRKYNDRKSRK